MQAKWPKNVNVWLEHWLAEGLAIRADYVDWMARKLTADASASFCITWRNLFVDIATEFACRTEDLWNVQMKTGQYFKVCLSEPAGRTELILYVCFLMCYGCWWCWHKTCLPWSHACHVLADLAFTMLCCAHRNGWKWLEIVRNGWEWLIMGGNVCNWLEAFWTGWKWLIVARNGWKWLITTKNDWEWLAMCRNARNGWKRLARDWNGWQTSFHPYATCCSPPWILRTMIAYD